jgi:hypothetical protein
MNIGLSFYLIDIVFVGAFAATLIADKAFAHKSLKDEVRKMLKTMREGYSEGYSGGHRAAA